MLTRENVKFTRHAVERINEMLLEPHEVKAALEHPDSQVPSRKHKGQENWSAGRVALGVVREGRDEFGKDNLIVVTAVWATREAWQADMTRHGGYSGRAAHDPTRFNISEADRALKLQRARKLLGG